MLIDSIAMPISIILVIELLKFSFTLWNIVLKYPTFLDYLRNYVKQIKSKFYHNYEYKIMAEQAQFQQINQTQHLH